MAGNNESVTEILFEIENKEEVKKFLNQLQKETELSKDIEQKIKDVFSYMWEHKIFKIESIYTQDVKFVMKVEMGTNGKS